MAGGESGSRAAAPRKRADARRNEATLLDAAAAAGEIRPGQDAYELLRGVGGLCFGAGSDPRYSPQHLVELLIAGLRVQ